MVDLNSSLSINSWSFYSILQQFEFKKNKKILPPQPTVARNTYRCGPRCYLSGTLTPGARRLTPRATATGTSLWPLALRLRAHSWQHLAPPVTDTVQGLIIWRIYLKKIIWRKRWEPFTCMLLWKFFVTCVSSRSLGALVAKTLLSCVILSLLECLRLWQCVTPQVFSRVI
jgi:hypothetical protein